jgi:phage shock protein C
MLFGVCGGLATYFDLDPTLVRLVFVLLTLATGIGLIVYIVMAIITPQDPAGES